MRTFPTLDHGNAVSGEVISLGLALTPKEAADLHVAFEVYDELARIIRAGVVPALGGGGHPAVARLCDLLREYHLFTGSLRTRHHYAMEQARKEVTP